MSRYGHGRIIEHAGLIVKHQSKRGNRQYLENTTTHTGNGADQASKRQNFVAGAGRNS